MTKVTWALWEPGDWVVTVDGKPVGQTLSSEREAMRLSEWLQTAIKEIREPQGPRLGEK